MLLGRRVLQGRRGLLQGGIVLLGGENSRGQAHGPRCQTPFCKRGHSLLQGYRRCKDRLLRFRLLDSQGDKEVITL
jgi:hypothetical protein